MFKSLETEQIIKFLVIFKAITIDARLKGKMRSHSRKGKLMLNALAEVNVYQGLLSQFHFHINP